MEVLRHPAACQVCSGTLTGSAEIELEREGDEYYITVSQTVALDWGICPRCKRVACYARCWDKQRSYCKSCPSYESAGNCPECKRVLIGAVEIVKTESFGIPTIRFEETPDRNWIQCDACSLIVCKKCCLNPKSGFCNRCLARQNENRSKPTCPVVAQFERYRFASANGHQSTQTKTQPNQGGQTK